MSTWNTTRFSSVEAASPFELYNCTPVAAPSNSAELSFGSRMVLQKCSTYIQQFQREDIAGRSPSLTISMGLKVSTYGTAIARVTGIRSSRYTESGKSFRRGTFPANNSDASAMLKVQLGKLPKVVVNAGRKFGHVVAVIQAAVSK
jgi:hypothetical protein